MKKYTIGTRFNDILNEDIIKTWKGNNVILNGATGSGKTFFIENNLYKYASSNFENILFLCNRTELYHQILREKEEYGLYAMDVMLYQTLQSKLIKGEKIQRYDYIACDEFHYVLTDSLFNIYTDLTYKWIMSKADSIKIFMSGTGNTIFNRLKKDKVVKEEFEYFIPYDYSYATIKFLKNKKQIFNVINHILDNTDDKIIYFSNSLELALEVYKQFKEYSVLRCSPSALNEEAKNKNDMECIKTYNKDLITFDSRLLITTKCLDNGVNIKDRQLKHIISDVFDLDSSQQCLGRKRVIDHEDKCTFYILDYSKKSVGNFKGKLNKQLDPLKLFVKNDDKFEKEYDSNRKFHSDYIYFDNGERKYNELAFFKMIKESRDIELMEKYGYSSVFLGRLGETIKLEALENVEEYTMKDELQLYLEDIIGTKLFKDEQIELGNRIGLKDKYGRPQTSFKAINTYLQENYKMYISKDTNRKKRLENGEINLNKDKIFWEINKGIIE